MRGLAGAWVDYDDDGYADLFVANEYGLSVLYRNRRDGTFEDVTTASGALVPIGGMGVAVGDYDGDGRPDVFASAMYPNSRWALFHPELPAPIPWFNLALGVLFPSDFKKRSERMVDMTRGSLHNGGSGFTDVSEQAGARDGQWGWGAEFLDYDNDGRLDLFTQNGFITGQIPDDV